MRAITPILAAFAVTCPGIVLGDTTEATKRARSAAFDATQEVRCAQETGEALGVCTASAARAAGAAAVVVTFANGFSRTLIFSDGAFLRGNATMSGVGTDTDWSLAAGVYQIRVDDQRFEIPKALVFVD